MIFKLDTQKMISEPQMGAQILFIRYHFLSIELEDCLSTQTGFVIYVSDKVSSLRWFVSHYAVN